MLAAKIIGVNCRAVFIAERKINFTRRPTRSNRSKRFIFTDPLNQESNRKLV